MPETNGPLQGRREGDLYGSFDPNDDGDEPLRPEEAFSVDDRPIAAVGSEAHAEQLRKVPVW